MPAPLLTGKLMAVGKDHGGHHRIVIFASKEQVTALGPHLYTQVQVALPPLPADPAKGRQAAQKIKGDRTKARLLRAAEELGTAASVRAITREAGCNEAAINYHFGSKQGLHEALRAKLFPVA